MLIDPEKGAGRRANPRWDDSAVRQGADARSQPFDFFPDALFERGEIAQGHALGRNRGACGHHRLRRGGAPVVFGQGLLGAHDRQGQYVGAFEDGEAACPS